MLYDLLPGPPPPGSPLESVLILVWNMRQDAHWFATRAMVQAAMDIQDGGKAANDAWKEYTDVYFPYLAQKRKKGDQVALESLMKEVKKGGFKVTPLEPLSRKARRGKKLRDSATSNDHVVSSLWQRKNRRK